MSNYNQYGDAPGNNPYSNPAGANSYEMDAVGSNPYGMDSRTSFNPTATNEPPAYGRSAAPQGDMMDFFEEVDEIKKSILQYDQNIDSIDTLYKRSVNEISEEQEEYTREQIESLVDETSSLSQSLKDRIKSLQSRSTKDSTKKTQAENLKRQFMNSIQRYQVIEGQSRQRYRERAARQYRIVRPEATDAEVRDAIDDAQGEQIFSQALMSSNRRGQAQTALSEVQNRHKEIQKIEQTMAELAQLFHDMELLVAEQEAPVQHIDNQTQGVQVDIEQGLGHTNKAVIKARAYRKKKWWCALICFIIIALAVGLGVGIPVANAANKN